MEGVDVRVPPLCVRADDFTAEEAAEILQSCSSSCDYVDKIISVPPCEPKAGEAYLFKPDSIRCKNDWKADQYRWYQNGTKQLPAGVPVIKKVYAINVNSAGKNQLFKRSSYSLLDNFAPIVNYTVSCSGDVTCPSNFTTTDNSTRSYTITNFISKTRYTFSVVATNSVGSGEAGAVMITTPGSNIMAYGGFTGSRKPHRNNDPSPLRRGRESNAPQERLIRRYPPSAISSSPRVRKESSEAQMISGILRDGRYC